MSERQDERDADWPYRPWTMAAIGTVAGLIIHLLTDNGDLYGAPFPVWKQAATAFTIVATVSFLLTVELRRWAWAIGFALGWGAVIAMIGWFTAQYNRVPEIFEFPFFSGILAVLIAAPLFQTVRDEGAWHFPYPRLHRHAWTDAVIGAASLIFTGITFLLAWLIAGLFDVIGIDEIKELLQEEWFSWMLAGLAFGGAIGLLRERDALAATLQRLVMVVLSVLAPVLAAALVAFLVSLPFKGLEGLWNSDIPATPLLLVSAAGAVLLANSVFGNGEEEGRGRVLRLAALALVACVLPLAVLAGASMGQRIGQYGWTPERIWGVVAVLVAIAYGLAAWWAVYKGRNNFDDPLRPLQTKLAIGLCGVALFLAMPLLDFGAISAQSQVARLESGRVKPEEFDWTAMAFDFGPAGRDRLAEIRRNGPLAFRNFAKFALETENRHDVFMKSETLSQSSRLDRYLRLLSPDIALTEPLKNELTGYDGCNDKPCALLRIDQQRLLLVHNPYGGPNIGSRIVDLTNLGGKRAVTARPSRVPPETVDLASASIEVRPVGRRQLYVEGKPVGEPFE